MKKDFKKIKKNEGQAMIVSVIFFLFISLAIISGLVSPSVQEFKVASDLIKSRQSFFLSESGVEDAFYRLKNAKPIGESTIITLNDNSATTNITDSGYNEKTISSLGDVYNTNRKNEVVLSTGDGISFSYGIQAGTGGFSINKAIVNGNVFANGTIVGTHDDATVKGTTISAGGSGLINNLNVGLDINGTGNAQAHTVTDSTVQGTIYCKHGSGNNKSCNTSLADPAFAPMPITQTQIDEWKADAALGETIPSLTISTPTQLGPKKINGNLTINDNLTITGTIYVTGRIIFKNGVHVSLSSSYGPTGGIIITDGYIDLTNNVIFENSGSDGSYILLLTTSSCPTTGCSYIDAIGIYNNAEAVILNAQNGTVHIHNNVTLNEVVGKKIMMDNGAEINYLSGLANTSFTSGPTGGWNIKSWKEVE